MGDGDFPHEAGSNANGQVGEFQPRVFISYSRQGGDDANIVAQIIEELEAANIIVFTDIENFERDEAWKRQAATLIREADSVIFVATETWALSNNCRYEYSVAKTLSKRLYRIDCSEISDEARKQIPSALQKLTGYDWRRQPFKSRDSLIRDLKKPDGDWHRRHSIYQILTEIWKTHECPEGMLLGGGAALEEAEAWLSAKPVEVEVSAEICTFIADSRTLYDQYKADLQAEAEQRAQAVESLSTVHQNLKRAEGKIIQLKNDIRRLKTQNRKLKASNAALSGEQADEVTDPYAEIDDEAPLRKQRPALVWLLALVILAGLCAAGVAFLWPGGWPDMQERIGKLVQRAAAFIGS